MRIKSRDESFYRLILGEIFKIEKKHILKKCYYCVNKMFGPKWMKTKVTKLIAISVI